MRDSGNDFVADGIVLAFKKRARERIALRLDLGRRSRVENMVVEIIHQVSSGVAAC